MSPIKTLNPVAEAVSEINASLPLRKIADRLDRMALSADVKAILLDLARVTVKVSDAVLQIGRKILTLVFDIIAQYQNTTFGLVIGVIIDALVTSIPFLGAVLGPFLGPLAIAFGLTKGLMVDINQQQWHSRLQDLEAQLAHVAG